MKTEQPNETLSETILNEARAEAEQIRAEAQVKAEAIRRQAAERAAAERKAFIDRGAQEVARLRGQAVSTAQLKARTSELEHRERLLNEVFQAARQKLCTVQQQPNYPQVTRRLLAEALASLRSNAVQVHADPVTAVALNGQVLAELSSEHQVAITLGEPASQNTGMVVETTDGHLNFDNTLETRLERMQGTLRYPVYQLLVGDAQ